MLAPEVLEDDLVVPLARAVAEANRRARELGVDTEQSLVTIDQCEGPSGAIWRVNYGPRDYIGRRGGDLIIEVDGQDGNVLSVMRGQ